MFIRVDVCWYVTVSGVHNLIIIYLQCWRSLKIKRAKGKSSEESASAPKLHEHERRKESLLPTIEETLINMSQQLLKDFLRQLLVAVKEENTYEVQTLLQSLFINGLKKSDLGDSLFAAIKTKNKNIVQLLIRNGAEITSTAKNGLRPIHQAAKSGSEEIVKTILNCGSPVNIIESNGGTALHYAAEFNQHKIACLLIKEGANVNRARLYDTGETPLHFATKFGRTEMVELMLKKGAAPNIQALSGETALHLGVRSCNFGVVEALCHGKKTNLEIYNHAGETPLLISVSNTRVQHVKMLLENGARPNNPHQKHGLTALHYVALLHPGSESHKIIANECISHGANTNQCNKEGDTPLHLAARSGNTCVVEVLLQNGAEVDAKSLSQGYSPLLEAVERSHTEVVIMLLEAGADVNLSNNYGMTALHIPVNLGTHNTEILSLLIDNGAKLNKRNNDLDTPLNCCIFYSFVRGRPKDNLKKLISVGASLKSVSTKRAREGQPSTLCWLTWHGDLESAEFLVNAGWNLNSERSWLGLPSQKQDIEDFLVWLRRLASSPLLLKCLCRATIREQLLLATNDTNILPSMDALPLPTAIKRFLSLQIYMKEK